MSVHVEYVLRAMPTETVAGDAAVVREVGDWTLFAVIDGLGHGQRAHEAASEGVEVLNAVEPGDDIEEVMQRLDCAMRGTRGAAATVCMLEGQQLSGCGVGNVELRARPPEVPLVLSPGILGRHVRTFRCFRTEARPGGRILLFSDGISARFSLGDFDALPARQACETLLSQNGRDNDDATVLVADIGG